MGSTRTITVHDKSFIAHTYLKRHHWLWNSVRDGKWEPHTYKIFDYFIEPDKSYIDIGSWIGSTILYGAQLARKAYGIEPDPASYKELMHNLSLNPEIQSNTHIENMCIGAEHKTVKLFAKFHGHGNDSMSSLLWEKSKTGWDVRQTTLPRFVRSMKITDCAFIKMDIEGGELFALPVAHDWLKKNRPTVFLSMHGHIFKKTGSPDPVADVEKVLESIRFYKYWYDNRGVEIKKDYFSNSGKLKFDVLATDREWK